jgi:hypothetical protein
MDVVYHRCAGLDVHQKNVVACRMTTDETGNLLKQIRRFSSMTDGLLELADWLREGEVKQVAMESTGVCSPENRLLLGLQHRTYSPICPGIARPPVYLFSSLWVTVRS